MDFQIRKIMVLCLMRMDYLQTEETFGYYVIVLCGELLKSGKKQKNMFCIFFQ